MAIIFLNTYSARIMEHTLPCMCSRELGHSSASFWQTLLSLSVFRFTDGVSGHLGSAQAEPGAVSVSTVTAIGQRICSPSLRTNAFQKDPASRFTVKDTVETAQPIQLPKSLEGENTKKFHLRAPGRATVKIPSSLLPFHSTTWREIWGSTLHDSDRSDCCLWLHLTFESLYHSGCFYGR